MATDTHLFKLNLISFLDSLNLGLIMPVLTPHIFGVGGSHTSAGLLASLHAVGQLVSVPIIRAFSSKFGRKNVLLYTLLIALASNVIAGFTDSLWTLFIVRALFYATNQTQTLSKGLVGELLPRNQQETAFNFMNVLAVAGMIFGPVFGGYLFQSNIGWLYICSVATCCSLASYLYSRTLPESEQPRSQADLLPEILSSLHTAKSQSMQNIVSFSFDSYWLTLCTKYLVAVSFTAFFMKFALLLNVNYHTSCVTIGYTVAYQSIVIFAMNFVMPHVKKFYNNVDLRTSQLQLLVTCTATMAFTCFAMTYTQYMLFFVSLALSRVLFDSLWSELYGIKRDRNLEEVTGLATKFASVSVPLMLGVSCDAFGKQAVNFFAVAPLLAAFGLTTYRRETEGSNAAIVPPPLSKPKSNKSIVAETVSKVSPQRGSTSRKNKDL